MAPITEGDQECQVMVMSDKVIYTNAVCLVVNCTKLGLKDHTRGKKMPDIVGVGGNKAYYRDMMMARERGNYKYQETVKDSPIRQYMNEE